METLEKWVNSGGDKIKVEKWAYSRNMDLYKYLDHVNQRIFPR